ncbi:Putative RxLR effector [Phytophthora palmivora]|uniref:RxLR effector n=1 Tax=Phytophthora palmivora TaxID=4796 RepID=A0A2P4XV19_9STRA|nr:Putative RxLR effector [Phytophthora palmivora]
MTSTRRFTLPLYTVMVVMICMASSVSSHLELTDGLAELPRQALSTDMSEKATATMRFQRGGDTNDNVSNEVVGSEERGFKFLDDAAASGKLKQWLRSSLRLNDDPYKVTKVLYNTRIDLDEQTLLHWFGYVLKYREKKGDTFFGSDAYVVYILSQFVREEQFPVLLKAIMKKKKIRSFAEELQKMV